MKQNPSTIRVQGKGSVSSAPDMVDLGLELTSRKPDYNDAVAESAKRLDLLRRSLPKADLLPDDLKTRAFSVSIAEEYVASRRVFRGYDVRHRLSLRIPFDRKQLGRVLAAVTASRAMALLSLSFTVSDPEEVKRRVLEDAVRNARSRAETIAVAAGKKLGAIRSIEYGHAEIRIYSEEYSLHAPCAPASPMMNFQPADIESGDTVLIVWELEGK